MEMIISNCVFKSSVETAIYIEAEGRDASQYMTPKRRHARINPTVEQCVFNGNNKGIELFIHGICIAYCSSAKANPIVRNCFFTNLTDSAFKIVQGSQSSGSATLINNDIINCNIGFFVPSSFDAQIKNNIFYGNTTAIEKTGTVSTSAYYNSFYNNVNNFVGYPSTYGDIVSVNLNGTPCDIGMNIFSEPLLSNNNNIFKLTSTSPCIDAGTSDSAPDNDFENDNRPQANGIDIGADEFVNNAPSANAGHDQVVFNSVSLDGSLSYDSDLDATLSYMWHLEHRTNSNYNRDAIGIKPNIQSLESGFYDVVLTVEDDKGAKGTDTMMLGAAGPWDIDNDKKLGLGESIYILQVLSGIR